MDVPSSRTRDDWLASSATPTPIGGCWPSSLPPPGRRPRGRAHRRCSPVGSVWRRGTCNEAGGPRAGGARCVGAVPSCACFPSSTPAWPARRTSTRLPASPATSAPGRSLPWSSSSWASVTNTSGAPPPAPAPSTSAACTATPSSRPRPSRTPRCYACPMSAWAGSRPTRPSPGSADGWLCSPPFASTAPPCSSRPPTSRTAPTRRTAPSRWRRSCAPSMSEGTAARPSSVATSTPRAPFR